MHLKLFVSLAVLAFASASLFGGKVISVNQDGSDVQVTAQNGVTVNIYKNRIGGLAGLGEVEITIAGPQGTTKTVRVNDHQGARIVTAILAQNQGIVDDLTFEQIVNRIEAHVQNGQIHPAFARALRLLENDSQRQVTLGENRHFKKQMLVEDILEKEQKLEALTEVQQQAHVAKNILGQRLAQNGALFQTPYGLNRFGQQNIFNKEAELETLTETQQQAEIVKENLERQIAREQNELAQVAYGQQVFGRQGLNQGLNQVYNVFGVHQGLNRQVEIHQQALVKDILRKQAKIQALTQVQEEAQVTKNVLKTQVIQEQAQGNNYYTAQNALIKEAKIEALTEAQQKAEVTKQILEQEIVEDKLRLNGQQGFQTVFGLRGVEHQLINNILTTRNPIRTAEIEKEAIYENILKKEAKIEALTQVQQEAQLTKDVLRKQAVQEQIFGQRQLGVGNTQVALLRKEAKIEVLTEAQQKAQATKNILRQQIAHEQQQLNKIDAVEAQVNAQNVFGLSGVRGYNVPMVYQHPSVWNQLSYRTQTPYTLGGRFNTFRGIYGLGQQQGFNQLGQQQLIQQQVEQQVQRQVEREIHHQTQQKQMQQQILAEQIQNQVFAF